MPSDADADEVKDEAEAEEGEDAALLATATGTEEEEDSNLQLINSVSGDKAIVEAVQKVAENKAQIIEYTDSSNQLTAALVLRLNVDEQGGETYFDDQRQTCIYGMKFDEFDEEVKKEIEGLEVTYNDTAISMCDPKLFDTSDAA